MKQFAASGQEAAANLQAMKTLAANQSDGLDDLVEKLGGENTSLALDLEAPRDVTFDYLQPHQHLGPGMLSTEIFVYRGLVQALLGRMDTDSKIGILLGEKNNVLEVCLAGDVASALSNAYLTERLKSNGLEAMGLVGWSENEDLNNYHEHMATLLSFNKDRVFLHLLCHPNGTTSSWEFNRADCPGEFVAVILNNKNKNRRKDLDFHVYTLGQVGVNMEDSMKSLVSQAVGSYISENLKHATARKVKESCFIKLATPPDGYCFWHSVLAALNLEKYQKVKRHSNGFATNSRQEKAEATAAKNLRATAAGDLDAEELFRHGYVGLEQVQWIGEQLNMAIRVTVEEKACEKKKNIF